MNQQLVSASRLHRLNRRQRKKHHVGEFLELAFEVKIRFEQAMDDAAYDQFIQGFVEFIEDRGLIVAGFGGQLPFSETDSLVAALARKSPSEEDRLAVVTWLRAQPAIALADAGGFLDAWYGPEHAS